MAPLSDLAFSEQGDRIAVVARIGREIWRKILPATK
jgi:hypothetical protein